MTDTGDFDYTRRDVDGYTPDESWLGTAWRHKVNGNVYRIDTVCWDGSRDLWMILHTRIGSPVRFARPVRNFFDRHDPA